MVSPYPFQNCGLIITRNEKEQSLVLVHKMQRNARVGVLSKKKVTGDHRGVLEDSVSREAAARPDWAGSDPLAQWKAIEAGGKEEDVPGLPSCPRIAAAPTSSSTSAQAIQADDSSCICPEGRD